MHIELHSPSSCIGHLSSLSSQSAQFSPHVHVCLPLSCHYPCIFYLYVLALINQGDMLNTRGRYHTVLAWVWNLINNIGNVDKTASMSMLTLFEPRYTLKGRYNIGNVGKTDYMSMVTLFEPRYTLKGRYSIGNVGKTASMSMLTLFES